MASTDTPFSPLTWINQTTLADIVRQMLGDDHADLASCQFSELYGGSSGQTFKVKGTAHVRTTLTPWSLVVKRFESSNCWSDAEPTAWDYWKREWLAHQAPWMQKLEGSLVPATCLGTAENPDGSVWVAMEDLSHLDVRPWSLACLQTVAQHVGTFNGTYLVHQPLPTDPWLSRGWLRAWAEQAEPGIALLSTVADHAVVRQMLSPSMIASIFRVWDERSIFYDASQPCPKHSAI